MANAQSDGKNRIKRMEFSALGKSYKFSLNPEEYTQIEPNRANITQTKNGAWVDSFGAGIGLINMKGTTGFKGTGKDPTTGYNRFVKLRNMIRNYIKETSQGKDITNKEFILYNYTDGDHWIVIPKEFKLFRSVSRSTMYMYDIQFSLLRPAGTARTTTTTGTKEGAPIKNGGGITGSGSIGGGSTGGGGISSGNGYVSAPTGSIGNNPISTGTSSSSGTKRPTGLPSGTTGGGIGNVPLKESHYTTKKTPIPKPKPKPKSNQGANIGNMVKKL